MEIHIIEKYLSAPDDATVRAEFEAWLDDDPAHKALYEKYLRLLERIKGAEPENIPDKEIVWSRLEKEMAGNTRPGNVHTLGGEAKSHSFMRPVWVAAAAVLLAVAGYVFLQQPFSAPSEFATTVAETKTVKLPDGSVVRMNADSRLRLAETYGESDRRVFLQGQAFFKVQNNGLVFLVETDHGTVTVVGTEFDVNSRYQRTEVIVREGIVRLKDVAGRDSVELTVNERGIAAAGDRGILEEQVDAGYLIGWLDDRFVFHKTPLDEAVDELERRYGVKIDIAGNELRSLTMSGSYAYKSIDATLESFCLALNLQYAKQNDHYIISRD